MKNFSDNFVEEIIKKAIKEIISTKQASIQLGITKQYVNKLKLKYQEAEIECFKHGNTGKQTSWKTDSAIEQTIIDLYSDKYAYFNFTHFLEKLIENENITISYGSLYRILTEAGFKSPKKQHTKKKSDIHPIRPRKENFGEMLQIDASLHQWFGSGYPKATLHGAIDDSTGTVMGLYFDEEETLKGYYNMLKQILLQYGIPETFYADNRTIFEYRKLSEKNKTIDRDTHIQFKRCCQQLGIDIITTSTPQAKGKIERLWGTLQSRLISELSLNKNRFVPAPSAQEINYYLSVLYYRQTDSGSCFKFKGKKLQLVDSQGKTLKIPSKQHFDIYETFDNAVVAVYNSKYYETKDAEIIEQQEPKTPEKQITTKKPKWKPAPYHPWRKFVISSYRKR